MSYLEDQIKNTEREIANARKDLKEKSEKLSELREEQLDATGDIREKLKAEREKLKKEEERLKREEERINARYTSQIQSTELDVERHQRALETAETKLRTLRAQLEEEQRKELRDAA